MSKFLTITEASSIAIHGMVLLAKRDRPMNVGEISEVIDSSKHHVAKVFQRLAKYNYVKSVRGPTGGFSLAVPPADISLLDIFESIEGKLQSHEACPFGKGQCPFDDCLFENFIRDATIQFKDFLSARTLDTYV